MKISHPRQLFGQSALAAVEAYPIPTAVFSIRTRSTTEGADHTRWAPRTSQMTALDGRITVATAANASAFASEPLHSFHPRQYRFWQGCYTSE